MHRSFRTVDQAVAQILADLPAWRGRVQQVGNRAVFEVPEILQRLLPDRAAPAVPAEALAVSG